MKLLYNCLLSFHRCWNYLTWYISVYLTLINSFTDFYTVNEIGCILDNCPRLPPNLTFPYTFPFLLMGAGVVAPVKSFLVIFNCSFFSFLVLIFFFYISLLGYLLPSHRYILFILTNKIWL